MSNAHIYILKL